MSKSNQKITGVDVTSLSHDGRGIASIDGKVVFVRGAIDGEEVDIEIVSKRSQYSEANTITVSRASPNRVEPRCPHFGVCGGCSLQHVSPEYQVIQKQEALLDQFRRIAKIQPSEIMPPIEGPKWGYRHKARLGVKYVAKKNKVLVGFREQGHRYLADLNVCYVLHPSVGEKLTELSQLVGSLSIYDQIPQLEIAVGDHHTAIIIRHLKPFTQDDLLKLIKFGQQHQIHLYLQAKGPESITKLWPEDHYLRLHYQLKELTLAFHPGDFTQVNPEINRQMVNRALDWLELTPTDSVLDLFCGLGNFSLPIAKFAQKVIGVEGSELMVNRAYENAQLNHINNAEFYCADLSQPLKNAQWAQQRYDKVLFDPPRSGALEMIGYLTTWQPKRLVYVSCNPATLARDTALIINLGYTLKVAGILDMFPQTSHVESMALFIKE